MKALVFIGVIGMLFTGDMKLCPAAYGAVDMRKSETMFYTQEVNADKVRSFIERRYPGARILDRDTDDGLLEVKIRHDGIEKMVLFNRQKQWLRTVWETRRSRLPKRVLNGLAAKGFPYERVDDNDNMVMENPKGLFYAVQVERGNEDYILVVSTVGRILHRFFDDEWDDGRWDRNEDIFDDWDDDDRFDDDDDRFDEGDDEWDDRHSRRSYHLRGWDDGEDHFDEGDDEWDDDDDD